MAISMKLECGHKTASGFPPKPGAKVGDLAWCPTCRREMPIVADESTVEWTPAATAAALERYAPPKGCPEHRDDGGDPNPGFGRGE